MNALKRLESVTQPYRVAIGVVSIAGGVLLAIGLAFLSAGIVENRRVIWLNNEGIERAGDVVGETRESLESQLEQLLNMRSETVLVCIYDPEDNQKLAVVNWPKSLELLLGWTSEEITDLGLGAVIPPDAAERHRAGVSEGIEIGQGNCHRDVQGFAMHKDGRKIPVNIKIWSRSDGVNVLVNALMTRRQT